MNIVLQISIFMVGILICLNFLKIEKNILFSIIISAACTIVELGFVGNILINLSAFSYIYLILSQVCLCVILVLFYIRSGKQVEIEFDAKSAAFMAIILAMGCFLLIGFRVDYVLGDRDPFVYYFYALKIAKTSTNQFRLYYGNWTQEAAYWTNLSTSQVDYGFLPFSSTLFSIGYLIANDGFMSAVNPIVTVISILLMYVICVKYFKNELLSFLTAFLLLVNPATIWNGRVTQSEFISQLILFLFMLLIYYAQKNKSLFLGYYSVFTLSVIHLVRIDMFICGLAVSCCYIYLFFFYNEYKKIYFRFFGAYQILSIIMMLLGFISSPTYYISQWNGGTVSTLFMADILVFAIVDIIYISFNKKSIKKPNINFNKVGIVVGLIGFLLSIYVATLYHRGNIYYYGKWFCLYVDYILFFMFLIGIGMALYDGIFKKMLFFIIVGMGNTVLYLYNPNIAIDNMWMSRRWITICIPFVIIYGVYGLFRTIKNKYLVILTCLIISVGSLYNSRGFLFKHIQSDLKESEASFADSLEKEEFYLTNNNLISFPMNYIYEYQVYKVDNATLNEEKFNDYFNEHEYLMYIGNIEELMAKAKVELNYELQSENVIYGTSLKRMWFEIPDELQEYNINANIYKIISVKER